MTPSPGTGSSATPSFAYGRALALVTGLSVMRLASADVVPYQFGALADAVERYAGEVKQLLASKGDDGTGAESAARRGGVPGGPRSARARDGASARLAFPRSSTLRHSTTRWRRCAAPRRRYDSRCRGCVSQGTSIADGADSPRSTRQLVQVERALDRARGPAGAALVPAHHLCARALHRLRREDAARYSGGNRTGAVGLRRRRRSWWSRPRCSAPPTGSRRRAKWCEQLR